MSKSSLLTLIIVCSILGTGAAYAAGRMICLLDICIVVTEGSGLGWRGININSGTTKVIQSSPMIFFGIAGACLVGALVKQDNK